MNNRTSMSDQKHTSQLEQNELFSPNVPRRRRIGNTWLLIFQISTVVGILALTSLLYNVFNDSMGFIAFQVKVNPNTITSGRSITSLSNAELIQILQDNLSPNRYRTLNNQKPIESLSQSELIELINTEIVKPKVVKTWSLTKSLLDRKSIEQEVIEKYPEAYLQFRIWLTRSFLSLPQSSDPLVAGIRTAILGSLWIIAITILVAFPIGVGAAIYLEEYASTERWINRLIQVNINNLAAVPSIIYGILGLTIFVRTLEPITSGSIFTTVESTTLNGRTILAGSLTLALLVLPLLIINSQEAIRAVPNSLRQGSYGLGATKWQTVWAHVLPNAIPGILTGTILAVSRAFGETAPLLVVGVSAYITVDPANMFSKFTTLPAQIYQWTSRPQVEWRNLAAAAILVLLILLLSLNAVAIILRNRYSKKYSL
jgi:phosphate transport system permease protein